MAERFVLWDVDGTLVHSGGVTARAFDVAAERVLGRHPGRHGVLMSGMTDPGILREILAFAGLSDDEAERQLPAAIGHLEAGLAAGADEIQKKGWVMPGVEAVLRHLSRHHSVLQSVLTGNTAANAALKLRTFGIGQWLDVEVGAFGSDHQDRRRLVPVALERARLVRGRSFSAEEVWVVGDTPRDLECARAAGARCLLVATGQFGVDELERTGADRVLPDLTRTGEVCDLLLA